MSRWLIALKGDPLDLDEYPYWFPTGPLYAAREENAVFLTGPAFGALRDSEAVRQAAETALQHYSAVISLLWPPLQPATLGTVFRENDDGTRSAHLRVEAACGRAKVRGILSGGTSACTLTQAQLLLSATTGNRHLEIALMLWAVPELTWPRLYRILEEIEASIGAKVHRAGLCTEAERKRFTHTANSGEAAGLDARHAIKHCAPPSAPLPLAEARTLIGGLLMKALRRQQPTLPGAFYEGPAVK